MYKEKHVSIILELVSLFFHIIYKAIFEYKTQSFPPFHLPLVNKT